MAFYFVAMFFWWAAPRHPMLKVGAVVLGAAAIAWQPRAIFFLVGVLVARTDLSKHPVLGHAIRWPLIWLVAFAVLWRIVTQAGADGGAGSLLPWMQDGRIGLAALGVSAAILAWSGIVGGHGLTCVALRAKPAQWLGSVSYSFYLWHLIVLAILKRFMTGSGMVHHLGAWSQPTLFAIGLPASLIVAQASAIMIERHFVGWLKTRRPAFRDIFAGSNPAYQDTAITIENTASLAA